MMTSGGFQTPVPTGFGPSKIMEYVASLPKEEQVKLMEKAMGKMAVMHEQAHRARTQEGLVRRFREMRAKFLRPGGIFADELAGGKSMAYSFEFSFSNTNSKPSSDVKSLRSLKPMIAAELEVGTTHRGRYLCGWVAVDDAFFGVASSTLLIEDVIGQLVEVGVYGLVDTNLPPRERQRRVAAQFPKGKPVVVLEPYYKVREDLTEGIRVDQPRELMQWTSAPTNLETWKQLGNEFFSVLNARNQGRGALACYHQAIKAVKFEVRALAVLLNNLATCRHKIGDFAVAIQLAGAAVHLDPTYLKAWFRLASSLMEEETATQRTGNRRSGLVATRVVAHACTAIPRLTPQQRRALEGTLVSEEKQEFSDHDRFHSYTEWCVKLRSPAFALVCDTSTKSLGVSGRAHRNPPTDTNGADAWRKMGSEHFAKGDFHAAEECYLNGVAASASCCRDVSVVLNNTAAVHVMVYHETSDVPGISTGSMKGSTVSSNGQIPSVELALLNCTVAGIIDPLNAKAWVRRSRCLQKLGFTPEECIGDLHTIQASAIAKSNLPAGRISEFNGGMEAEVQRLSLQSADANGVLTVSEVPTDVQREERDAMDPERLSVAPRHKKTSEEEMLSELFSNQGKESIDQYIARMEGFLNVTRFAVAASKSKPSREQKEIPREMVTLVSNPPPQVHVQFPKQRGWPDGIDSTFARKMFYRAFLDACCNPWVTAMCMRQGSFYQTLSPADLVKRWHGTGAMAIIRERTNLRFGDIIDARETMSESLPAYDARIRSNFANNPNRAEVYFFGTTHVAIGFNDFSSLVAATLRDKSTAPVGPLRFVGFEMSEFSVAKCKVVAHMLGSPDVAITSVMEVWLSSTWSETTLKDFRMSVAAVLESLQGRGENPNVMSYMHHWASAETISAAKARSEFFSNLVRYNSKALLALYCFRRDIDQLDLAQYMLTGGIRASQAAMNVVERGKVPDTADEAPSASPVSSSSSKKKKKRDRKKKAKQEAGASDVMPLVGSLTMWNVPPGAPPLEEDIAFNTVDFMTIVDDYTKLQEMQRSSAGKLSVVDLFMIQILRNLQRLRDLMMASKLTIEVMYGVVKAVRGETVSDPVNQKLLAQIAMMRPYTISWSNVLDYFLPEDFHDLARRCSVYGDCVHYGYSMNWPTQVFGVSIMDYDPEDNKTLIDGMVDAALGFPSSSGMGGMSSSLDLFRAVGMDELLLLPIREHPLDSTGFVLAHVFKSKWVEHFMKQGELTAKAARRLGTQCTPFNRGLQEGAMELGMPSPLYRCTLTLYMSWCYDPGLRLRLKCPSDARSAATRKW